MRRDVKDGGATVRKEPGSLMTWELPHCLDGLSSVKRHQEESCGHVSDLNVGYHGGCTILHTVKPY